MKRCNACTNQRGRCDCTFSSRFCANPRSIVITQTTTCSFVLEGTVTAEVMKARIERRGIHQIHGFEAALSFIDSYWPGNNALLKLFSANPSGRKGTSRGNPSDKSPRSSQMIARAHPASTRMTKSLGLIQPTLRFTLSGMNACT